MKAPPADDPRAKSAAFHQCINAASRMFVVTKTSTCLQIDRLICRSERATHMRVACGGRLCSRRCRWTVVRTTLPASFLTLTQP